MGMTIEERFRSVRYGNLSNELAHSIGVRFEHIVYNFGKVNQPGKALCEDLLQKDCNLYFFTLLPERKVKSWCYKWGVMYTNVIKADSTLEIPELCRAHVLLAYFDTDDRLLQAVRERGNPPIDAIKWEQPLGFTESTDN